MIGNLQDQQPVPGLVYKQNSNWTRNDNEVTRTKISKDDGSLCKRIYCFGEIIGSGAWGSVGLLNPPGENLRPKAYKQATNDLKAEFEIAKRWENKAEGLSIHHKAYFPSMENFPNIIVMHLYDKTLEKVMHNNMSCLERLKAICQISQGVATLHSLGIIHQDIYAANVMYDAFLERYDLIDFGTAKVYETKDFSVMPDIDRLHWLIFSLFGARAGEYKSYYQPTLSQIQSVGFDHDFAEKILTICQNMPRTAEGIQQIFSELKQSFTENNPQTN